MGQLRNKQILFDSKISFSGGQFKIENVANGTNANDAVNFAQFQALQSTINNFEWQPSVLSYITDNTVVPPSENTGDRYALSSDGGTPHVDYDGASAGDIVEFDGTSWIATTPGVGTFISADDEPDRVYLWGGSSWAAKEFEQTTASTGLTKVGFDIQLDSSAAGNGLSFNAGSLNINAIDATIVVGATGIQVGTITTSNFADFGGDVEDVVFDSANFVDSTTVDFTVTAGDSVTADVLHDNSTIVVGVSGLEVGTITTSNFADFAGDVEDVIFDAANFVDSSTIDFTVTAGDSATAEVLYDNSTIVVGVSGLEVGTITTANFADFAQDVEDVVFDAANFVDSSTINFTVTAGDSATAELINGSVDETKLQGLGTGATGQMLTSDGAGGFVWTADNTGLFEVSGGADSVIRKGLVGSTASGAFSIVLNGDGNSATTANSAVLGGTNNTASGTFSSIIVGGTGNTLGNAPYGTILNGSNNSSNGFNSLIVSGYDNTITSNGDFSKILGGANNTVDSSGVTILHGFSNTVSGYDSVVSGNSNTVSGSYGTVIGSGNTVSGIYGTVIGGGSNTVTGDFGGTILSVGSTADGVNSVIIGSAQSPSNTAGHTGAIILGSGITANSDNTTFVRNFNIVDTPTQDDTNTNILVRNSGTGVVEYRDAITLIGTDAITNGTAQVTSGDGSFAMGTIFGNTPMSSKIPTVTINGLVVDVRGDKTGEAYFSSDAGVTATAFSSLTTSDDLYWNGSVAGYELDTTDKVKVKYEY